MVAVTAAAGILEESLTDTIATSRHRPDNTSTPHHPHDGEITLRDLCKKNRPDQTIPEIELLCHRIVPLQLTGRMTEGTVPDLPPAIIQRYLGGCGTGIQYYYYLPG
jgi:hypothetical protein